MDILIIGAGLSGATIANKFAKKAKKVLVIEKRKNVAGNVFDKKINDVLVHTYGPHIFHTDSEKVNNFMNEFWELNNYKNIVAGNVLKKIIPLPFNFTGIDEFWPNEAAEIKKLLIKEYGINTRVSINKLRKNKNKKIVEIVNFVYKNIFQNYTEKMWGCDPEKIDPFVLDRVPVVIGYNNKYFSNKFEGIPKLGYANAVTKMLENENIEVRLGVDATNVLELRDNRVFFESLEVTCPIIYCGPIDELFNFSEGALNYRSLDIHFETIKKTKLQNTAVVNYPAHPTMTRIVEYKHMTFQQMNGLTVISKEFPGQYDPESKRFNTPYYPMANAKSRNQYHKYVKLSKQYNNLHLVGRLATFRYLDMDKTINEALDKAKELLN